MSATASLPMYLFPHTREAWRALWSGIASELNSAGIAAPANLDEPDDLHAHWRDPGLVLSQSCAMPMRLGLHEAARVVGAWDFGLRGCPPGSYNSILLSRAGEARPWRELLEQGRIAVNATDSQSGYQVLADLAGCPPEDVLVTGSHHASVRTVRDGDADLCAVDAETWRLIVEAEGGVLGVEVCHRTPPTPGLPLIAARDRDPEPIARAIEAAVVTAERTVLATLHIHGFLRRSEADYSLPDI